MKGYKLTRLDQTTRNKTKFEIGVPVYATGTSPNLCSDGWIHFYTNPLIAVLMNPAHANFNPFLMFECETSGGENHDNLMSGCKILTITKQIAPPTVTLESKIAFGLLCAIEVCDKPKWLHWAENWLSGADRTGQSADATYAYANAYATYATYSTYATYATYAPADATHAATHAATYAYANANAAAAYAAYAATHAPADAAYAAAAAYAYAATHAVTYAPADATYAPAAATKYIDFVALAEKALTIS